jgi:hypothetical protein
MDHFLKEGVLLFCFQMNTNGWIRILCFQGILKGKYDLLIADVYAKTTSYLSVYKTVPVSWSYIM